MEKDYIICFETTLEIRNTLEKIAEEEKLTVSLVVESMVCNYLKDNKEFKGSYADRRRFERKAVDIPAFIGNPEWRRRDFKEGKILDISLGGIRFSVPKGTELEIQESEDSKEAKLSVIFTLPKNLWAVNVKFKPKRVYETEDEIQIGAALVNPDYHTYMALQNYLM